MFSLFRSDLNGKRKRLLPKLKAGPLRSYLEHPFPDPNADYRDIDYLALDLETTGLDAKKDAILSVGLVMVRSLHIELATATQLLIAPKREVAQSATIHHITDDAAAQGLPLAEGLEQTLRALQGKVLIAHHAVIETDFLNAACQRLYGGPFLATVVDTVRLERQLRHFRLSQDETVLRLDAARAARGLPRYRSHDALTDALACAELFLSQSAEIAGDKPRHLSAFL